MHREIQKAAVKTLVKDELAFSYTLYPDFVSPMEGLGVIQEEYDEAMDEIYMAKKMYMSFKKVLRENRQNPCTQVLKEHIEHAIIELIQVSAMLDKYSRKDT
jgi:hypothetical protein